MQRVQIDQVLLELAEKQPSECHYDVFMRWKLLIIELQDPLLTIEFPQYRFLVFDNVSLFG